MPQHLECEVLQKVRCTNTLTSYLLPFTFCCSLQTSIDQQSELEHDLSLLESWIPTAFDRINTAADTSSAKSAEQLEAQMKLLLVSCLFAYLPVVVYI